MDDGLEAFQSITGASEQVAQGYLQITNGDTMQAVQLYFENPELQNSFSAAPAASSASAAAPAPSSASGSRGASRSRATGGGGRQDARGVIHIDSDDDDDFPMDTDADDDLSRPDDDRDNVTAVARNAQEEEDAAMARRLQEEMYSENPSSADGVRAPIERTTETLVAPDPTWNLDDLRRRRQQLSMFSCSWLYQLG